VEQGGAVTITQFALALPNAAKNPTVSSDLRASRDSHKNGSPRMIDIGAPMRQRADHVAATKQQDSVQNIAHASAPTIRMPHDCDDNRRAARGLR
jgi:hypothetical protein